MNDEGGGTKPDDQPSSSFIFHLSSFIFHPSSLLEQLSLQFPAETV
jgi:hypothetical protein